MEKLQSIHRSRNNSDDSLVSSMTTPSTLVMCFFLTYRWPVISHCFFRPHNPVLVRFNSLHNPSRMDYIIQKNCYQIIQNNLSQTWSFHLSSYYIHNLQIFIFAKRELNELISELWKLNGVLSLCVNLLYTFSISYKSQLMYWSFHFLFYESSIEGE